MISQSNRSVYVADVGAGESWRHLITIVEPGKICFFRNKADGSNEFYRCYNYMPDDSTGSPEWAGVINGNGGMQYRLKHNLSDGGVEIATTPFANFAALPTVVETGKSWVVGDYATVISDQIFGAFGEYGISAISEADSSITWKWSGGLRGENLGIIATKAALPTTVTDTDKQIVGAYYEVNADTITANNGNYIISDITSTAITYTQQYALKAPYVMTTLMDLKDNAVVNCDTVQMADYIDFNFGAALAVGERILVHVIKPTLAV